MQFSQTQAATIIAQRFWYAKVRWTTRSRMGRIIMRRFGLDYERLKQAPMSIDQFMQLIVYSPLANVFARWMQSVICRCKREADTLSGDMLRLSTNDQSNAINRVLSAFLFALYGRDALDISLPGAYDLYQSAVRLCLLTHACLEHTTGASKGGSTCLRTAGRKLIDALSIFLEHHSRWLDHNGQIILQRLAAGAIMRMHELIGTRSASVASNQPFGSYALRSMAATGEMEPIRRLLFDSPAVRVMRRMAHSELWGSHGLHTLRFAHELMIDPEYRVTMEQTVPLLSKKYAPHRHVWSADELIFDAGTVVMWECQHPEDISDLAEAIDLDMFPERLHDLPGTVERICGVIARLMPYGSSVLPRADPRPLPTAGSRESLERLIQSTLTLRNSLANAKVDALKEQAGANSDTPGDYLLNVYHANTLTLASSNTRRWVQEEVQRCGEIGFVGRLARGDPFALLKFHDHAVIDTIVGQPNWASVCYAVPDILYLDLERIHQIRQMLHSHYKLCGRRRETASAALRELVTSGESVSHPPHPEVAEAADKLRTVVYICRYKHGNMIARLAQQVAQDIARASSNTLPG